MEHVYSHAVLDVEINRARISFVHIGYKNKHPLQGRSRSEPRPLYDRIKLNSKGGRALKSTLSSIARDSAQCPCSFHGSLKKTIYHYYARASIKGVVMHSASNM